MSLREGKLREEYREWYPALDPGTWYPAAWLTRVVLEQLREGEPRWQPEPRVPSDAHFSFRGGNSEARTSLRSRMTDASARETQA